MGFFPRHDASIIIDGCNNLRLYYASRPPAFHVVNPTTPPRFLRRARECCSPCCRSTPASPSSTRCSASRAGFLGARPSRCPTASVRCRALPSAVAASGSRTSVHEITTAPKSPAGHCTSMGPGTRTWQVLSSHSRPWRRSSGPQSRPGGHAPDPWGDGR